MSRNGQDVIESNGYVRREDTGAFTSAMPSGRVVVAGSSSVTPVMEKLKEAYAKINPGANIEIQQSDSSTGMNATIDGICDIGMASRELKSTELEKGLTGTVIAIDGIAVIVNKENPLTGLTRDQVKAIYLGQTGTWNAISR
jgi:phosphate transport system substrate-binding protein